MFDYKSITQKLEKALYMTSNVLNQNQIKNISDDIHAGEWG